MPLQIDRYLCRQDNYAVLLRDVRTGFHIAIDVPDADLILAATAHTGMLLTHIWVTHHHMDHIGGIPIVRARFPDVEIWASEIDAARVPYVTRIVRDAEVIPIQDYHVNIFATPGHTRGAVSYWLHEETCVFVGDTLFDMGCGRLLEGNAVELWCSLELLSSLPYETRVYCGHDYTRSNGRFACAFEPHNPIMRARVEWAEDCYARGVLPPVSTIGFECMTNPFLRCDNLEIQSALGMLGSAPFDVFAALRRAKDIF